MLLRAKSTTFHQIICDFIPNVEFIVISMTDPDDTFQWAPTEGMNGLKLFKHHCPILYDPVQIWLSTPVLSRALAETWQRAGLSKHNAQEHTHYHNLRPLSHVIRDIVVRPHTEP